MDTKKSTQIHERIEASAKILSFLVETEGLSHTIRLLQYALEKTASEISLPQNGNETDKAANYLKVAELLDPVYQTTKDEYKL